jgi:hypothetical protein
MSEELSKLPRPISRRFQEMIGDAGIRELSTGFGAAARVDRGSERTGSSSVSVSRGR